MPLATVDVEDNRPNWQAFGMLVAWSGAGVHTLLSYVRVVHSLDAPKLAIIAAILLWLAFLAILARASLLRSNLWNLLGDQTPASLFIAWGVVVPLLLWGVGKDLQFQRGFPAVEAMCISGVNIFISVLPLGGVVAQHVLFLIIASMELWASSPATGIMATSTNLMATAINFALGVPACCLLCLAHNRRTILSSPPAAAAAVAGALAGGHADERAAPDAVSPTFIPTTADTQADAATQSAACTKPNGDQEGEVTYAAGQGPSSNLWTPFGGLASMPSSSLCPSSQPPPSGWTPARLKALWCYTSVVAWLQRAELWLLAAVPHEEAKLLATMLSAVFVGTRFLACVANYTVPGTRSPSMDILGLLLAMLMGGSGVLDLQGWASTQHRASPHLHRAYWSVRGLLRNIMPAHVADALEAYEAEREFASMAAFGAPSGAMLHLQSSSNFRKPSDTVCGGLIRAWPKISQPGEVTARSWSGSVRSHPPVFQGALARSACHPPGSIAVSESKNALESERKLGLLRRRSFSERHEQVTVLFADIVGFTTLSDQLHPSQVMTLLGDLYKEYDELAAELDLYTLDTIGDCYMCAANLIKPLPNHVNVMVGLARRIIEIANATLTPLGTTLSIRVGIHTGPLMSGVIGVHRLKFTLLGDTVNVASRMQTTAIINTVQISEHAYEQLRHEQLALSSEATREQGLDAGGCGFWDMDGPSLGEAREQGGCSVVRGDCATRKQGLDAGGCGYWDMPGIHEWGGSSMVMSSSAPCLPVSMHEERRAALPELECISGSCRGDQGSKSLHGEELLQQQQQGQQCQEEKRQQHHHQQQCFLDQPEAQGKGGENKTQEPQSLGGESHILSQGAVTPSCTVAPAEQSSHTQQPGGPDRGPGCPSCWLPRKLNIKGKGIMRGYTYTGP